MIFPSVTTMMLYKYPITLTSATPGESNPTVKSVILATLCSNPAVINTNKHQNIIINLATSFLQRKLHHTAKQTSILQSTPLINNGKKGTLIFTAEVLAINSPTGPVARPVK